VLYESARILEECDGCDHCIVSGLWYVHAVSDVVVHKQRERLFVSSECIVIIEALPQRQSAVLPSVKNEDRCLDVLCIMDAVGFEERSEWALFNINLSIELSAAAGKALLEDRRVFGRASTVDEGERISVHVREHIILPKI
jgi:hypothetical protein